MIKYIVVLLALSVTCQADMQEDTDAIARDLYKVAAVHTAFKQDWEGMPQLFLNQLATNTTIDILKKEVNAERPDKSGDDSFPSGHTGDAFAPAFYIYQRYGAKESIPYFLLSSYVGYARVKLDKHHPHDVAASVLLSYGMSKVFVGEKPSIGLTWNEGFTVHFFKEF